MDSKTFKGMCFFTDQRLSNELQEYRISVFERFTFPRGKSDLIQLLLRSYEDRIAGYIEAQGDASQDPRDSLMEWWVRAGYHLFELRRDILKDQLSKEALLEFLRVATYWEATIVCFLELLRSPALEFAAIQEHMYVFRMGQRAEHELIRRMPSASRDVFRLLCDPDRVLPMQKEAFSELCRMAASGIKNLRLPREIRDGGTSEMDEELQIGLSLELEKIRQEPLPDEVKVEEWANRALEGKFEYVTEAMRNWARNERAYQTAQKRSPPQPILSLDEISDTDSALGIPPEILQPLPPEHYLDRVRECRQELASFLTERQIRIIELSLETELTQTTLAKRLGCSERTIRRDQATINAQRDRIQQALRLDTRL